MKRLNCFSFTAFTAFVLPRVIYCALKKTITWGPILLNCRSTVVQKKWCNYQQLGHNSATLWRHCCAAVAPQCRHNNNDNVEFNVRFGVRRRHRAIGDVADEFMLPCQRMHAMTVTVCMAAGFWTALGGSQVNRLDNSATKLRQCINAGN